MNVAENLRKIRKEKGYSQSQIAEILNTTQQQYSKYENGTHEIPVRHIATLCEFYNITSDEILGFRRIEPKISVDALLALNYIERINFSSFNEFIKKAISDDKYEDVKEALGPQMLYMIVAEKLNVPIDQRIVEKLSMMDDFE